MKGNELAVYRYVDKPDVRNQGVGSLNDQVQHLM